MTKVKKIKNISNDELAVMINQGFHDVDKKFEEVKKRFDKVDNSIKGLKDGQENIELRLANFAFRFELQELQQRVVVLEKKTGIKK